VTIKKVIWISQVKNQQLSFLRGFNMDFQLTMVLLLGLTVTIVGISFSADRKKKKQEAAEAERLRIQEAQRKVLIQSKYKSGQWSKEQAQAVYNKQLAIDMTKEMVETSWG